MPVTTSLTNRIVSACQELAYVPVQNYQLSKLNHLSTPVWPFYLLADGTLLTQFDPHHEGRLIDHRDLDQLVAELNPQFQLNWRFSDPNRYWAGLLQSLKAVLLIPETKKILLWEHQTLTAAQQDTIDQLLNQGWTLTGN